MNCNFFKTVINRENIGRSEVRILIKKKEFSKVLDNFL